MSIKTIVHISSDFPDPLAPAKTHAVRKLVSGTDGFRHVVYSLNRVNWSLRIAALDFGPDRKAVAYGAPPKGLYLETRLNRVADWILDDIRSQGLSVDALHLHKLSVEGLVGLKIARALKRPFIVNIWGDSDLKILGVRGDLKRQWNAVVAEASLILPCAPWALDKVAGILSVDHAKAVILPCIAQNGPFSPSPVVAEPKLISVFHLDSYRRKNFESLTKAVVDLSRTRPGVKLDVYGEGGPKTILVLDKMIRSAGAEALVSLKGPITDKTLGVTLQRYAAFVMPTRRETFGMVFIEALFAGVPVLHTRGWGIDGFFEPDEIGYACDPTRISDIVYGIDRLLAQQEILKPRIRTLYEDGRLKRFETPHIVETYRAALERVLNP